MKRDYFFATITVVVFTFINFWLYQTIIDTPNHESWSRGYTECMSDVIDALVTHDEVRLGNLVINEPNAYVHDVVFFVVDPNQMGAVVNANFATFEDCSYNALSEGYEYPEESDVRLAKKR